MNPCAVVKIKRYLPIHPPSHHKVTVSKSYKGIALLRLKLNIRSVTEESELMAQTVEQSEALVRVAVLFTVLLPVCDADARPHISYSAHEVISFFM